MGDTEYWSAPMPTLGLSAPSRSPPLTPAAAGAPCAAALPDHFQHHGQHVPCTAVREPASPVCRAPTRRPQEHGAAHQNPFQCDSDPDPSNAIARPIAFALGLKEGADAPVGCHPPCASTPCALAADRVPVLWPSERARGETVTVGHWIDAALADEGWWGAEQEAQWSLWGGCFKDSDEA